MKTKLLIIVALFISFTYSLQAKRYVDITRSGGFFGHYNYVNQTYQGIDQDKNTYWSLTCSGPGFEPCRLHNVGSANVVPRRVEIDNRGDEFLADMLEKSNTLITNGEVTGTMTEKFQVTLSDGSNVLISIVLKWKPNPSNPEEYKASAEISDINI